MVRTNDDAPNCSAGTAPRQDQLPQIVSLRPTCWGSQARSCSFASSNPAQPYLCSSSRGIDSPITGATIL